MKSLNDSFLRFPEKIDFSTSGLSFYLDFQFQCFTSAFGLSRCHQLHGSAVAGVLRSGAVVVLTNPAIKVGRDAAVEGVISALKEVNKPGIHWESVPTSGARVKRELAYCM